VSPFARAVRTFLSGLAGVALTAAGIQWATDYRVGVVVVGLALLTVLVAAVAAFFLAYKDMTFDSALGKAFAQFAQMVGAGLGVLVFNTLADVVANATAIRTLLVTAALSALSTFLLNKSEETA